VCRETTVLRVDSCACYKEVPYADVIGFSMVNASVRVHGIVYRDDTGIGMQLYKDLACNRV